MARVDSRELGAIVVGGVGGALARVWLGDQVLGGGEQLAMGDVRDQCHRLVALAYFATRLQERLPQSTYPASATLGSYTTFSTWMLETHRLGEDGQVGPEVGNAVISVVLGVEAAALGRVIGVHA